MGSRKTILASSSLVMLQVLSAFGFTATGASAQSEQLVAVLIGEKSRDACEVQYRRSNDDNWGAQTIVGPPEACQGGLVMTYVMTQDEANHRVAPAEVSAESEQVRVVPLTGDEATDEAAIGAEVTAIHQSLDPGVTAEDENLLGFMAPGALANLPLERSAPAASVLAANCKTGSVGQRRRADMTWKHKGEANLWVKAYVYYRRTSCSQWKIYKIESRQIANNYDLRIWLRDIEYTKTWVPAQSRYMHDAYWLGCPEVFEGSWTTVNPSIIIQANGNAQVESVDTNPHSQTSFASCVLGKGTSAASAWTYLPGGTR